MTNVEHRCITAHIHPVSVAFVLVYFGATHIWGACQDFDRACEQGRWLLGVQLCVLESRRCCHECEHAVRVSVVIAQHPRHHVCKHLLTCVHDLLQGIVETKLLDLPRHAQDEVSTTLTEATHLHPRVRCVRMVVLGWDRGTERNAEK